MFGLEIVDLITLAVYLLGITALGVWMGKTIKNSTDYFVGGRRFGKLLGIFSVFGAGTHSDQAVSVVAKTYTSGMSGIWYQWLYLFVTPFNWWIAPILRRCRAITTGDYFEARYSRGVATLYVLVGIGNMMVAIGVMLKGSGAVIRAVTGGQVSEGWAIVWMTIMFVAYGVVGGLAAAIVTDFVQGLLTIVFSFVLLPFALYRIGGFSGLHEGVARTIHAMQGADPAGHVPDPEKIWSLASPGEIGYFYIAMIVINALIGIVTQPHVMPISGAVKTERESQIGSVYGSMIKRVCTIAWTLLGMYAIAAYPGLTKESDQCFGLIAHDLLPQMMPGLIGIFIAALLASIMSSCDAFMITCSALFTQNIYRPFIAPHESQRHYVGVGRVAAVLTVAGGVLIAYALENVIQGLELLWKVPAMMGIAFWAGLFWRRATAAAVWCSTLTTFAVVYVTSQDWFVDWARVHAGFLLFTQHADELHLPRQMVLYLAAGAIVMVVVSLLTRAPDAEQLDRFYSVLRTPVQPGEVIEAPLTLPRGASPGPQRKLIDHHDFEIQRPTPRGLSGFFLAWGLVATLIALVCVLVRIGA